MPMSTMKTLSAVAAIGAVAIVTPDYTVEALQLRSGGGY